jgi:hypothetical protein
MSKSGNLVIQPTIKFDGAQVFSATMAQQRERLGDNVTEWLTAHPKCKPTEFVVTQSSDAAFHCITITVFYKTA